MFKTSHDLARVMRQTERSARRVLNEIFPDRDENSMWQLDEQQWRLVLYHLAYNKTRQYGGTQKRKRTYRKRITRTVSEISMFQ